MTLKQLEYFLACATLNNFRKAAQLHYISPPTLTRQISALEDEIGVCLFERDSHNVRMTDEGAEFFRTAYDMLVVYRDFYNRANASGMKLRRRGTPFLIGSYAFDGMYGEIVDRILSLPDYFLNRQIHIDFIDAGMMIPSVMHGDIHVGIDSEQHIKNTGNEFEMLLLKRVPFQAAVGPEHPLFGRKSICIDELLAYLKCNDAYPVNMRKLFEGSAYHSDPASKVRNIGEYTIERLPELLPVLDNVHMGRTGIAILPETLTAGNTSRLHRISIEADECYTKYMLFWLRNKEDIDIRRFAEHMK